MIERVEKKNKQKEEKEERGEEDEWQKKKLRDYDLVFSIKF